MNTRPIIGLKSIHRRYFVSEEGEEIISWRSFRKMSKEMQDAGVLARVVMRIDGRPRVRMVAVEPFFSIWRQYKLCGKNKNREIKTFMGVPL